MVTNWMKLRKSRYPIASFWGRAQNSRGKERETEREREREREREKAMFNIKSEC